MSTEICINYSNALREESHLHDSMNCSYSDIEKYSGQEEFKEALIGNVNKEFLFCKHRIHPAQEDIEGILGSERSIKAEATLDHCARANVPGALVYGAFVNHCGGQSTLPYHKKALYFASKAFLQGNYDAAGYLLDELKIIAHPLVGAYRLEFEINTNAEDLYYSFCRKASGKGFTRIELNEERSKMFEELIKPFISPGHELGGLSDGFPERIRCLAEDFSLGCISRLKRDQSPGEKDTDDLIHFVKCMEALCKVREYLKRHHNFTLTGWLNMLLKEVCAPSDDPSFSRTLFDKSMEILITRLFLENYKECTFVRNHEELKDLAEKTILEFEESEDSLSVDLYGKSPYVLRLIALYDLYIRNSETYNALIHKLNKCRDPLFYAAVKDLDIERLLAASLGDLRKHYNGTPVCTTDKGYFSYNREALSSYLSDRYSKLASVLRMLCDSVTIDPKDPILGNSFNTDCIRFIRCYMALDPVLAYNDCEFASKLSVFIQHTVDWHRLPPKMLADVEKPVPYYGYTSTSAIRLYFLRHLDGDYWSAASPYNEADHQLTLLRLQIAEQDLHSIVMTFSLFKDNPSENYDYLLKEFLHSICCHGFTQDFAICSLKLISAVAILIKILLNRAEEQEQKGKAGIAAECLSELMQREFVQKYLSHILWRDSGETPDNGLRERLNAYRTARENKFPKSSSENMIIGDSRDCGLYTLNLLNLRYREIKKIVSQNKKVNKETLSQKLSSYHKLLYTYNLCHPLANNGGIFSDFEQGNLSYIVNSFYPENIVIKSDAEDPENDTIEVPYPEQVEAESDE